MKAVVLFTVLIAAYSSEAAVFTQDEWSSPGVNHPVRKFSCGFQSSSGINWLAEPGSLVLDYNSLRHGIDALPAGVSAVLCEDMNSDGSCDIVAGEFRSSIVVYENTGDGSGFMVHPVFQPEGLGPERLICSDLDGDGDLDIAGTSRGNSSLGWVENRASSQWIYHLLNHGEGTPLPLDAGDIDEDGDQDILAGLAPPGKLVWLENTGIESEWPVHEVDGDIPSPYWVSVLPGQECLLATSFADSAVYVYWPEGSSWRREMLAAVGGPLCIVPADMNGDETTDLLVCSSLEDRIFWLEIGNSTETVTISREMIAPSHLSAADLDNDGDIDVLGTSESAGEVVWWENTDSGRAFFPHYAGSLTGASSCATGDLNGDGIPDPVAGSLLDGSVSWYTVGDYSRQGSLTSSVLYIGSMPDSLSVDWQGTAPDGTNVNLQIRLSADRTRMGSWIDVTGNPGDMSVYLEPDTRFIQYRINLSSDDMKVTPVVERVTIEAYPAVMI